MTNKLILLLVATYKCEECLFVPPVYNRQKVENDCRWRPTPTNPVESHGGIAPSDRPNSDFLEMVV